MSLLVTVLLGGCSDGVLAVDGASDEPDTSETGQPDAPPDGTDKGCWYVLAPNTIQIDETHDGDLLAEEGRLVVSKALSESLGLAPGMILVGSSPEQPFLRRVVAIADDPRGLVLETEPAALTEAFEELHVDPISCVEGVQNKVSGEVALALDTSQGVVLETERIRASGDVSLSLGGRFYMRIDIGFFRLEHFEVRAGLALRAELALELAFLREIELLEVELVEFPEVRLAPPTPIGPIVVTPLLSGELELEVELEGALSVGFEQELFSLSGEAGVVYDGELRPIAELEAALLSGFGLEQIEVTASGGGLVELSLPVAFNVRFFELAGPGLQVSPYFSLEAEGEFFNNDPLACREFEVEGRAGLSAEVEGEINPLGLFELEWEYSVFNTAVSLGTRVFSLGGACCGDGVCHTPEESCENCPDDCGDCPAECSCTDSDRDGFHSVACGDPLCPQRTDCDDNNPNVNPGADEVCGNNIDDDCNGGDQTCPPNCTCNDNDRDGFYPTSCNDGDCPLRTDCDDNDANVNPNQAEVCGNGRDDDCSGGDQACPPNCACTDNDGDGYYPESCNDGDCPRRTDCDDNNPNVNPGADEVCGNNIDDDCNGGDQTCPPNCTCNDNDRDGFYPTSCNDPDCSPRTDCDDNDANVNPNEAEVCGNGRDDDCSGGDLTCPPECGNGTLERNEDCDGDELDGESCVGLGYDGGSLRCGDDCDFDTSWCEQEVDPRAWTGQGPHTPRFGCTNDGGHHHSGNNALPLWTYVTNCPRPSVNDPGNYSSDHWRWTFTVEAAGDYQLRWFNPRQVCTNLGDSRSFEVHFVLERGGEQNRAFDTSQTASVGSWRTLTGSVHLQAGTHTLYLYDNAAGGDCCSCFGEETKIYADHIRVVRVR